MTPSATLSFKNQIFASFYEAPELCKGSDDGGLLILLELLNDRVAEVETFQDFLIKFGIKSLMHLLEISMFSLNNVILRLTKIMNRADENWAYF